MRLQAMGIAERGRPNGERLQISVLQATTLSHYVVLLSNYLQPTSIASGNLSAYWFPPTVVKAGDHVLLFSGHGQNYTRKEVNGSTTYAFYWGLRQTVWRHPASCAVLVEAANWATTLQGG